MLADVYKGFVSPLNSCHSGIDTIKKRKVFKQSEAVNDLLKGE
jgi:hypothetical protein